MVKICTRHIKPRPHDVMISYKCSSPSNLYCENEFIKDMCIYNMTTKKVRNNLRFIIIRDFNLGPMTILSFMRSSLIIDRFVDQLYTTNASEIKIYGYKFPGK